MSALFTTLASTVQAFSTSISFQRLRREGFFVALALCLTLAMASPNSMAERASININTAGPEHLSEALVGVGLAKAYRIVEHRESFGPFESIDELVEVQGIGPSIVSKNRARIVLE